MQVGRGYKVPSVTVTYDYTGLHVKNCMGFFIHFLIDFEVLKPKKIKGDEDSRGGSQTVIPVLRANLRS